MDIMIADLPHIQYHPNNNATREQEENRLIIARDMQQKIKKRGLPGVSGLNLAFKKEIIDGNRLLQDIEEG
jgi:hypothetical protein